MQKIKILGMGSILLGSCGFMSTALAVEETAAALAFRPAPALEQTEGQPASDRTAERPTATSTASTLAFRPASEQTKEPSRVAVPIMTLLPTSETATTVSTQTETSESPSTTTPIASTLAFRPASEQ